MSTTTMHFGPEWMRTKHQPLARTQPPSPPLSANNGSASTLSTYSALVSATPSASFESGGDVSHPFRYSKEELLKIYQEGGGKGGLGLEVERWEGVVREGGTEPATLHEMSEAEKKLFAGPLNSELRRRPSQSTEYLSPLNTSGLERPRLNHASSSANANSPLRERFGTLKRKDSAASASDMMMPAVARKPSLTTLQSPLLSPRDSTRGRGNYTPGFDGVLNNGESWVSRRRASETAGKGVVTSKEATESFQETKPSGIREEKEEDYGNNAQSSTDTDSNLFSAHSSPAKRYASSSSENIQDITQNSLSANGSVNSDPFGPNHTSVGPPPGLVDLASVEWSYKDPTGQVQGPFRADLMQKWYNDGYFSGDLPMKRVRYDSQWTTVAELIQRSNGENIFLSPIPSFTSFSHGSSSGGHIYSLADQAFIEPLQPAPIRSLRTSTLESYVNGGSDSPSSSVGASHFGNPSPDSSAFGGWDNKLYYGGEPNGRPSGFGMSDRPSPFSDRRIIGQEFQTGFNTTYNNYVPDRDLAYASYGYNNVSNLTQVADIGHLQQRHSEINNNIPLSRAFNQSLQQMNGQTNFAGGQHPMDSNPANFSHYNYASQPTYQNSPMQQQQYASPVRGTSEGHLPTLYSFRDPNDDIVSSQSPRNITSNVPAAPSVPWSEIMESSVANPTEQPEATSTASASVSNPTWNDVEERPATAIANESLTLDTAGNQESSWKDDKPSSHVDAGPHDQEQELHAKSESLKHPVPEPQSEATSNSALPFQHPSAKKVAQVNASTQSSSSQSSPATTETPTAISSVPKMAWVKEDESKKKTASGASVSLREIQEAEAKKLESRKAAEREKERAARAAASDLKEELQPFTASWGLPTSQAGTRGTSLPREAPAAPAQTPVTPVWTTSLKPVTIKKTMKEIQEEEEVRKKSLSKEPTVSATPKRPYADTTTKSALTSTSTTSNGNNVWTTVGPSGKATPVTVVSGRLPAQVATPAPVSTASTSRPMASSAQRVGTTSSKPKHLTIKQDDTPDPPSHDFLKWLSDSLKGLNASVNVEEIVSMLLSFPLEPDASTTEIISDTIYSNSTTLDGRRFASEFVAKRKADAIARAKGNTASGKAPVKPISIADVVKATPKAVQPEWGFKVVNKKKKGGRA